MFILIVALSVLGYFALLALLLMFMRGATILRNREEQDVYVNGVLDAIEQHAAEGVY